MSEDDNNDEQEKRPRLLDPTNKVTGLTAGIPAAKPGATPPFCSFCGRGRGEYRSLVSGPDVFICDRCIRESSNLLKNDQLNRAEFTGGSNS